jgi:hypothetical protein
MKEALEEVLTSLQQDGRLYLIEEEWDVWRKKSKMENHFGSGPRGSGAGKGRGCGGSSSSGSLNKCTNDECRRYCKMGIRHLSAARRPRRRRHTSHKTRRRVHSFS